MAEHCYPDKLVAVIKPEAKPGRRVSPEGGVGQNERLRLAVVVDRRHVILHCADDFSRRPIKCAVVRLTTRVLDSILPRCPPPPRSARDPQPPARRPRSP